MKRLALFVMLLAGCAGPRVVSMAPPASPPQWSHYVDELKHWSRHGQLMFDFDATMIVDATLWGPQFREAYTAKYLHVYEVTDSAKLQVSSQLADDPDTYELHVETQTHTWEINDLKTKKTIWRVTLINDAGQEVSPSEIRADQTRPEVLQIFFPYTQIFSKPWRVRFPRKLPDGTDLVTPATKSLTLRIAGPPGSVDLVWKML